MKSKHMKTLRCSRSSHEVKGYSCGQDPNSCPSEEGTHRSDGTEKGHPGQVVEALHLQARAPLSIFSAKRPWDYEYTEKS